MTAEGYCVHCGRACNSFESGKASVERHFVCHPNVPGRPDCYHMITVYHHELLDCPRCSQDPYQPLTRTESHDALIAAIANLERLVRDALP